MRETADRKRTPAIAVDLGGTNTRVALVWTAQEAMNEPEKESSWTQVDAFPTNQSYAAQFARLGDAITAAIRLAEREAQRAPIGVGVSLGGRIARDGASVLIAPNLRDYEGRPFVEDLSASFGGLPVRLAHDAVCGLLAERRFGALLGVQRCAYLTLSTGTGCAVHLAPRGNDAGVSLSIELGHQILDHNARACLCGQIGCLETYTGGLQLALRFGQPIETLAEAESAEMWREFAEKLSIGLVNLAHLTRVERIAIGGAIALNHPGVLDDLRAGMAERLRNARLDIVKAALKDAAPLVGAAALLTAPEASILH